MGHCPSVPVVRQEHSEATGLCARRRFSKWESSSEYLGIRGVPTPKAVRRSIRGIRGDLYPEILLLTKPGEYSSYSLSILFGGKQGYFLSFRGISCLFSKIPVSYSLLGTYSLKQWCQRGDLNSRPKAYESSALPLSYSDVRRFAVTSGDWKRKPIISGVSGV
jgi:hypothetical protein